MTSKSTSKVWAEAAGLNNHGLALFKEGQLEEAVVAYQRAVDVSRAAALPTALATALDNLSVATAWCGRIEEALAAHGEALAIFQSVGDVDGESSALCNLAAIHLRARRSQAAIAAQQRAIEVCRAAGNRSGEGRARSHLGQVLIGDGNLAGAIQAHREAVDIWRGLADRQAEEAGELATLALRLAQAGRYTAARGEAEQAVGVFRGLGRQAEATNVQEWLESLPANDAEKPAIPGRDERTGLTQVYTVDGGPYLAAVGAVITLALDGPWIVVVVLCAIAAKGRGRSMSSLVCLAVGAVVVWKSWGTWWLLGGLALLVIGSISLALAAMAIRTRLAGAVGIQAGLGILTHLNPSKPKGQKSPRQQDWAALHTNIQPIRDQ